MLYTPIPKTKIWQIIENCLTFIISGLIFCIFEKSSFFEKFLKPLFINVLRHIFDFPFRHYLRINLINECFWQRKIMNGGNVRL